MLNLVKLDRSYGPEIVSVMTTAFERVRQSVSNEIQGNDDVCRSLALIILRHVDEGEREPVRLADAALRELAGADRLATRDRSASARN
jgi:hypothetical protein